MNVLETRVLSIFETQAETIKDIAKEAFALENEVFIPVEGRERIYKVRPDVATSEVPMWNFTIMFRENRGDKWKYLVDLRPYENVNRVTQPIEYMQAIMRANAVRKWEEDRTIYQGIAGPLVAVYADWMTGLIRNSTGLSNIQLAMYEVMFGLYMYAGINAHADPHMDAVEIREGFKLFAKSKLRISPPILQAVLEGDNGMIVTDALREAFDNGLSGGSLNMLLAGANRVVNSPSAHFDMPAMVTLAEKSWMGSGGAVLAMAAVQHPALLASLVSVAAANPIYRRSRIGQAVDGLRRKGLDAKAVFKAIQ
ncbi:hypothetical protein SM033_00178 [Vibrio phage vB_VpaM_sm033]|nr:hypothetical protein SM033_00178 [Vibrio phage vB_VpaM_sm033]